MQLILSKWWERAARNSWQRVRVSWRYLMGRTYPIASFETARCIGIVRTMVIFEHLIHLKICVMRCFGIVRTIPTSSSSCSLSRCFTSTWTITWTKLLFYSDFDHRWHGQHCLYVTLLCIVDWLIQWSKDYSDTTVFGWLTLWMSNRAFYSTLTFEAVRCYLYVESWFGEWTLCSDNVLYSEEDICTVLNLLWITSFLRS